VAVDLLSVAAALSLALWLGLAGFRGGFWRADQVLPADTPAPSVWPTVVAVVPARNEASTIAAAVRSLLKQRYEGELRIVVVDDELVVAIVPVSCQLSMKRVASALGAKRATMCEPAAAERSSGYIVGGISPIGQRKRLRTVIDETAELFDTVYVSGGRRGMDVGLAPNDLIAVLGAVVAPITA